MTRRQEGAAARPPLRFSVRPALLVALVAIPVLLYARTTTFDFVFADDADLIAGNQAFLGDLSNAPRAFVRSYFETDQEIGALRTYYRPVTILSFMIDAQIGGIAAWAYHGTNVVLHVLATFLLFRWAYVLGAGGTAAALAALLFAVHPLNAQAVAWMAGRNELLLAVFALLSMTALARFYETGQRRWAVSHLAWLALALFSKETAVVLPPLAAAWWKGWKWWEGERLFARPYVRVLAWQGAIVAVWAAMRAVALEGADTTPLAAASVALGNASQLLVQAGKIVAPVHLNVMPGVTTTGLVLGGAALLAMAWAAWRLPPRIAGFSLAWLLAFLVPPLVVPDLPAYEHRMYVPLMGAALAVAFLPALAASRRYAIAVAGVVVLVFAARTAMHAEVFRDRDTYWANGAESAGFAAEAHVNLGQFAEARGDLRGAQQLLTRALELDPDVSRARNNLGVVMMRLGNGAQAEALFREEAQRFPWNADAWFNLGLYHAMGGDLTQGIAHWERAVEANRFYLPAYERLAEAYEARGDFTRARRWRDEAEALVPDGR